MKRQSIGRILIFLGVLAWPPYFALKLSGADVEALPFLIWHLLGVVPGAILAPSETLWHRIMRRINPPH